MKTLKLLPLLALAACSIPKPGPFYSQAANPAAKPGTLVPAETPPWDRLFDQNSPGHAPPGAPLLIVQGAKDPTVEPHWAQAFAARACARHEVVELTMYKNTKHLLIAYKAKPEVTAWIAARFAGAKPPDNCPA